MKVKTKVKAGGLSALNHNQKAVKTAVKAGGLSALNHNQKAISA